MKKLVLIIIFFFLLGAICSLLPLTVNFMIEDSEKPIELIENKVEKAPEVEENELSTTSVANGVIDKLNQITDLTNSFKFPIPESPKGLAQNNPLEKTVVEKISSSSKFTIHSPTYISNFMNPEVSCNDIEIVGQIFDKDGKSLNDMVVIGKPLDTDTTEEYIGYSGAFQDLGPAGYQIKYPAKELEESVTIQLFNKDGESVSDLYTINLYSDCERNFVILNFSFDDKYIHMFFPLISN
jgi:hypothetical protein